MVLQTKSTVITLLICCLIVISCNSSNKNTALVSLDIQEMPWMRTECCSTLISDGSGFIRYRSYAKITETYLNAGDSYLFFPEGIYTEQLDSLLNVEASITADTAYYYEKKDLWHAIGNVFVNNAEGRTFETDELFWDSKVPAGVENAFYTHKMVKITEIDGSIHYGLKGFKADQSLNSIFLYSGKGELNIDESTDLSTQNPAVQDSIM